MRLAPRIAIYVLAGIAVLVVLVPAAVDDRRGAEDDGEIIDPNASLLPCHPQWSNLRPPGPPPRSAGSSSIPRSSAWSQQPARSLTGMLAGYAFAMFDFPAKRILFYLVLSGLMIPFTVVLVPVVQLLADVGWVNTWQGLIVPNLASALGAFLFRQFFLGAPLELGEAARIDGASELAHLLERLPAAGAADDRGVHRHRVPAELEQLPVPAGRHQQREADDDLPGADHLRGHRSAGSRYNLLMAGSLIAVIPVLAVAMIDPAPHRRRPHPRRCTLERSQTGSA